MIDWTDVDTVLLDMDGTLLDLHFDNFFWKQALPRAYAQRREISLAAAKTTVFAEMRRIQGTLDWYCLDYWQRFLQIDLIALKQRYLHKVRYRPGAQAFLRGLRAAGKRRVLVTNAHHGSLGLKRRHLDLDRHLDGVHSAHDFGVSKEMPAFWDALQRAEGFDPARTVFVDDSHSVLATARDWGLERAYGIARPDLRAPPMAAGRFPLLDDLKALVP